jgi:TolB-like protein
MKNYSKYLLLFLPAFLIALVPFCTGLYAAETSTRKGIMDSLFGLEDTKPPDIELDNLTDGRTVYTEKIYISGQVTDVGNIKTLTVNETPVLPGTGRSIFFSHLSELREGKNILTIEARDEAGNTTKKDITVIRENPQLSKLPKEVFEKRMRLAVYPFDQKGVVSEESSIFMDMLALALQNQNRFQLIERVSLDRALAEHKLSLTQVVDRNAAVNVGKLMSAQAIITGSIIETRGGIEIVGRMIDTETSEIMATEKIYSSKDGLAALNFLAQSLSVRLHNDFPMLGGIVVTRKGSHIFTSLGQDKVALNGRLIIYRDNGPETDSMILGYARITQVLQDMSKAEMIKGRPDEIRKLDWVIVQ